MARFHGCCANLKGRWRRECGQCRAVGGECVVFRRGVPDLERVGVMSAPGNLSSGSVNHGSARDGGDVQPVIATATKRSRDTCRALFAATRFAGPLEPIEESPQTRCVGSEHFTRRSSRAAGGMHSVGRALVLLAGIGARAWQWVRRQKTFPWVNRSGRTSKLTSKAANGFVCRCCGVAGQPAFVDAHACGACWEAWGREVERVWFESRFQEPRAPPALSPRAVGGLNRTGPLAGGARKS